MESAEKSMAVNILAGFISQIEEPEILIPIGHALFNEGLIEDTPLFGSKSPNQFGEQIKNALEDNSDIIDEIQIKHGFVYTGQALFKSKKKIEQKVHKQTQYLIGILLCSLFFLIGFSCFQFPVFIQIAVCLLILFLPLFLFYNITENNKKLIPIEEKLTRLNFIAAKFELISDIEDKELKNSAYKQLTKSLNSPIVKINSIENMIYKSNITASGNIEIGHKNNL